MATIIKGLSYFPVSVDFLEDDIVYLLISDYGLESVSVLFKLLCKIYRNGYYLEWDEKSCKIFKGTFPSKYSYKELQNIINILVEENFFDKPMYEKYHILTSKEIQTHYFTATQRRKLKDVVNKEYLLIDLQVFVKTGNNKSYAKSSEIVCNFAENVAETAKNVAEIGENADNFEERKEKERKVYNFFNSSSNSESAKNFSENDSEVETVEAEVLTPDSEQSSSENVFQIVGNGSGEFEAKCHKWYEELRKDEEWLSSIVRSSGKGMEVLNLLKEVLPLFESHIISMGESGQITTINDYKRRFINWWRCLDFKSAYEIQNRKEKKRSYNFERRQTEPLSNVEKAMECGKKAKIMAREILRKSGGLENVF